ncbi:hypothetical protein B0H14DRAFT_1376508 [Mycena olivaceomarginata]|nr:hypothetical protein B0H14DRAFT_1376508 [Mycena olivaceomarginata]
MTIRPPRSQPRSMSHLSTEPNSRNRRKHRNIHSHSRANETRSFALDRFKARRSLFAWLFLPTSFGATEVLSPRKISLYFCLLNRNGHIFFLDLRNNYPTSVDALPWTQTYRRPTLKPNLISRCTAPPSDSARRCMMGPVRGRRETRALWIDVHRAIPLRSVLSGMQGKSHSS